ncbi:uncharacterized protein LOC124634369 [Helicoverpa zea]|uniref:uncharacterized protein LOC124634369 n=1 Tax=Helicoverpa zea TaxID=7113 RepID=UPI001F590484|nr:uncharacterized protein LOC124634369 [Helicoverpa zea]
MLNINVTTTSSCACAWGQAGGPGSGCAGAASTRRTRCAPALCAGDVPWAAVAARPTPRKEPFTSWSASTTTPVAVADARQTFPLLNLLPPFQLLPHRPLPPLPLPY